MRTVLLASLCLVLVACGRSGGDTQTETLTCTIVENVMMCPDGTEYDLPVPVDEPVNVITIPAPDDVIDSPVDTIDEPKRPKYVCQKHKKKMKRILCRIIKHWSHLHE